MKFISYAQNFEDVMLWRALKFFDNGFYIDVGANDPTSDSVTRAFYERGWSGINIEPAEGFFEALQRERPKDINLQVAAGESEESNTFYELKGTGLSTMSPSLAEEHKDLGRDVSESQVKTRTLTSICDEFVDGDIHFLKIDVEGYEESVLKGMDFSKYRPWIILIETPFKRDQTWEPILLEASYKPVLFDGLNTFYLSQEQISLAGAFEIPPCFLDEFQLCYGHNFSFPVTSDSDELLAQTERANRAEAELVAIKNGRVWRSAQFLKRLFG